MSTSISNKVSISLATLACLVLLVGLLNPAESKLLRPARYYDDADSGFNGPYGGGPYGPGRTGERAIVTVRGARDTYSGLPPRHMTLESGPYAGSYPRGIYDRLDGYGGVGGRRPLGMMSDLVPVGSFGGPRYDRYGMNGFDRPSVYDDAPARIAVTGVYPTAGGGFQRGRY